MNVTEICTLVDVPVLWSVLTVIGLLLAALDFLGLTSKLESFIDLKLRAGLEKAYESLRLSADAMLTSTRQRIEQIRRPSRVKSAIKDSLLRYSYGWIDSLEHTHLWTEEQKHLNKAIETTLFNYMMENDLDNLDNLSKQEIHKISEKIHREKSLIKQKSDEHNIILNLVFWPCLLLTVISGQIFIAIPAVIMYSVWLYPAVAFLVLALFRFTLTEAYIIALSGSFNIVLNLLVRPVLWFLRLIDRPPSGTVGTIGFGLAIISAGKDLICADFWVLQ